MKPCLLLHFQELETFTLTLDRHALTWFLQ